MSICLIDTSIFCNIVNVPNMDQDRPDVMASLDEFIRQKFTLLLPTATIIETGNHIAHCGDGRVCRQTAERFVTWVMPAIDGVAPWTPTPMFEPDALRNWLAEFPEWSMRGLGLADLSILKEWERQRQLHRHRRVFIWSLDRHLASYDHSGA